jgi:hypothetical protein
VRVPCRALASMRIIHRNGGGMRGPLRIPMLPNNGACCPREPILLRVLPRDRMAPAEIGNPVESA